jgi:hypothetical protein
MGAWARITLCGSLLLLLHCGASSKPLPPLYASAYKCSMQWAGYYADQTTDAADSVVRAAISACAVKWEEILPQEVAATLRPNQFRSFINEAKQMAAEGLIDIVFKVRTMHLHAPRPAE